MNMLLPIASESRNRSRSLCEKVLVKRVSTAQFLLFSSSPPLMVRPLKQELSPCCEITLFEQATNSVLFLRDNSTTSAVYNILAKEIECYSLPYGGLGFASHVLTYYTIVCLWYGRKPMMPSRPVKYSWFDLILGVVGLCVSTAMSIVTIARCRNTWQLLVIAVWKLSMSLLNGITAIHVAVLFVKTPKGGAEVKIPMDDLGTEREEQASQLTSLRPEKLGQKSLESVPWWILLCKAFYGPAPYHNC